MPAGARHRPATMIDLLTPLFRGEWAAYGETLQLAPRRGARGLPLTELLDDPARLDDALARQARRWGVDDPRPLASAWSLAYFAALLPPVAAAASLLEHGFPVRLDEMRVELDADGAAAAFFIPHRGAAHPGAETAARYAPLMWQHLEPLIEHLARRTRLSPRVLWCNASRHFEAILERAAALGGDTPTLARDREVLLQRATWPDGRRNPLHRGGRGSTRGADGDALYRQCCLYYRLPGEGYCSACPLAPQHRPLRVAARRA